MKRKELLHNFRILFSEYEFRPIYRLLNQGDLEEEFDIDSNKELVNTQLEKILDEIKRTRLISVNENEAFTFAKSSFNFNYDSELPYIFNVLINYLYNESVVGKKQINNVKQNTEIKIESEYLPTENITVESETGFYFVESESNHKINKNETINVIVDLKDYDRDGFNKDGYDRNGFDRDGYDKDGYDKFGFDKSKKPNKAFNVSKIINYISDKKTIKSETITKPLMSVITHNENVMILKHDEVEYMSPVKVDIIFDSRTDEKINVNVVAKPQPKVNQLIKFQTHSDELIKEETRSGVVGTKETISKNYIVVVGEKKFQPSIDTEITFTEKSEPIVIIVLQVDVDLINKLDENSSSSSSK